MNKITAWSYSRWNEYENCPRKSRYKVIDKLKEPGSPAMDRGGEIHSKIEHYLQHGGKLPAEVHKDLKPYYTALRKAKPKVELEICFDNKWQMTDWFGMAAWCRVKIDALIVPSTTGVVRVVDHKTGKLRDYAEYENQLELYALAGLLTVPVAKEVLAELAFTDQGVTVEAKKAVPMADLPKLKKKWELKVKPMLNDTIFAPRPGNACRWCHFKKSNGGPCEY